MEVMTEMTLTGLRVVLEVARSGSFSAAAENLGYTQSAVSRQVAASERATGGPLFERRARGVRPTAAGEVVVRHAGQVFERLAAAHQELAGIRDRLAGRLVLGGYPTAMAHLIPRAVARLLTAHPDMEVQLIESSTPSQLTALRRGRLEVAVLATGQGLPDYDLDGLDLTELRGGRGIGVAVAEAHPFAGRTEVSVHDLTDQRWIVGASTNGSPEFGAWPDLPDPKIAFSVRGWSTRFGLVSAGLGIALVPGSIAAVIPRGVCWVPVRAANTSLGRATWAVTTAQPSPPAIAAVRALVDEVRSWSTHTPT